MKQVLATDSDKSLLDGEHPWPGLRPFTEENAAYFFGREQEIDDIVRKVKHETLTLLFGKSGLGKTSLLRAGLSPLLRKSGFVPIYIRLNHFEDSLNLEDQVEVFIEEALEAGRIDAPRPVREETLWEHFHKKGGDWWDEENRLLKPILIFDQFEEILTSGQENPIRASRSAAFLTELEDLIENRPPKHLLDRFKAEKGLAKQYDLKRIDYRVMVALREDYLADLEDLRERLRTIMQNRYRLLPMNNEQAMSVVMKPGGHLVDKAVASDIVEFVSSPAIVPLSENETEKSRSRQVEPALLSIILRELNNHRIRSGDEKISSDLVINRRPEKILSEFYEESLKGLGSKARLFIERQLLTASGARNRVAESDAIDRYGLTKELINTLIDRRIIHREKTARMSWLELSHDTLTQIISLSAQDYKRSQRRRRYLFRSVLGLAIITCLVVFGYLWQAHEQNVQTKEAAKLALEVAADLENNYAISMRGKQRIIARLDKGFGRLSGFAGESKELKERNVRFLLTSAAMDIEGGYYGKASEHLEDAQVLLFDAGTERLHFPASNVLLADYELLRAETEKLSGNSSNAWRSIDKTEKLLASAPPSDTRTSMELAELRLRMNRIKIQLLSDQGNWGEVVKQYELARAVITKELSEDDTKKDRSDGGAMAIRVHRQRLFSDIFRIHAKRAFMARMLNLSDFSDIPIVFEDDLQQAKPFFKGDAQRQWTYFRSVKFVATALEYQAKGDAIKARTAIDTAIDYSADLVQSNPDNLLYRYWLGGTLLRRAEFSAAKDPLQSKVDIHAARALSFTLKEDSIHPYIPFILSAGADYRDPEPDNTKTDHAEKMLARIESYREEFGGPAYIDSWALLGYYKGVKAHIRAGTIKRALKLGDLALSLIETKKEEWDAGLSANRRYWIHEAFLSAVNADKIEETQWQRHYQGALEAADFQLQHHPGNSTWIGQKTYILEKRGNRCKRKKMQAEAIGTFEQLAIVGLDYSVGYPDQKLVSTRTLSSIVNLIKLHYAAGNWGQLVAAADLLLRHVDPASAREIQYPADELKYWKWARKVLEAARTDMAKLQTETPTEGPPDVPAEAKALVKPDQAVLDRLDNVLVTFDHREEYLEELVGKQRADNVKISGKNACQLSPKSIDLSALVKKDPKTGRPTASRPLCWRIPSIYPDATSYRMIGESFNKTSELIIKAEASSLQGKKIHRIRSSSLPFYDDGQLLTVEFNTSQDEPDMTKHYLRSGDWIHELNGLSKQIHEANKAFPLRLRAKADVAAYLRFFCTFVKGDEGHFLPVESVKEISWSKGVPQDIIQQVEPLILPMTIWSESDQPDVWYCAATINYSNALFHTKIKIDKTGMPTMLEDSPIAGDLPIDTLKLVADRGTSNYIDRLDLELISGIDISDTKKEIGALADLAGQCDDTQLDRLRGIVNEILALAQPRLPDDMTVDDVISAIKSYFSAIELIGGASSKIDFMTIPRIKACIKKSQEVIEKACEQGDRSNIKKLTNAYLGLSFLQLEIRDFNGALISSERGAALNPDYLPIYTNYAHALLFLGRVDEAKSVYLEHKGKPLQGKTWEAVILDDFAIFEKVGLSSPEMVQVRKLMDQ